MRHRPNLYVPGPWAEGSLGVGDQAIRHMTKVLRYPPGAPVTYTDGMGIVGSGTWSGSDIDRGEETQVVRSGRAIDVIVAAPNAKERQRFLVEKCQELGVRRLRWLATAWSSGRVPPQRRVTAWAVGALEQSRGAWLMAVDGPIEVEAGAGVLVADVSGRPVGEYVPATESTTIVVGPEGGFAPEDLPDGLERVQIVDTVLRTETAAVVGAAILRSM
ncbi:Ribosomal RNA small subunit methyltransferase E [hydrothermal vent metagenome]|uniref:16S rRNA (uracil(1498)-N(3))-methyltransferase n=1 Tax=hydrothermal vent metagenome TaxID=652676 RepID=A0A3B0SW26_9ZZZZ